MKDKIEELFKDIETRVKKLAEDMKSINPDHWLCTGTWYVDEVDIDGVLLITYPARFSEPGNLDHEDLSDEGMVKLLEREAENVRTKAIHRDHMEAQRLNTRKAQYEELKKEFG